MQLSISGAGFDMPRHAQAVERLKRIRGKAPSRAKHRTPNRSHRVITLDVLRAHQDGLTTHEIAGFCSLNFEEVCRRIPELQAAGCVVAKCDQDGKKIKRRAPTGYQTTVWIAVS